MSFEGKTAIVTGGASGIGRVTLRRLAESGAKVICADIDSERGSQASKELQADGLESAFVRLDLESQASIEEFAVHALERTAGCLDVLINGAGWDVPQPFLQNTPEFIDKVMAINLVGPINLTKVLLPAMIETGGGKIVNVASDAGRVGNSGETAYAAAKGGLIAFTKSVAREHARDGINVNCVCPGPTDTPLLGAAPEKVRKALTRAIPFGRIAEPEEITDSILFMASDEASYITGQVVSVSGGLTMAG